MSKESKHVKSFRQLHLNKEEKIQAHDNGYIGNVMGAGDKKQNNGSLIVTDQRVAFYRKGIMGEILETIPLANITSIERKSFLGFRSIKMHTSHDSLEFKTSNKQGEADLVEAIEAGRGLTNVVVTGSAEKTEDSPMDMLKKLGELKEAGVLTEEEFLTKKEELLKRI